MVDAADSLCDAEMINNAILKTNVNSSSFNWWSYRTGDCSHRSARRFFARVLSLRDRLSWRNSPFSSEICRSSAKTSSFSRRYRHISYRKAHRARRIWFWMCAKSWIGKSFLLCKETMWTKQWIDWMSLDWRRMTWPKRWIAFCYAKKRRMIQSPQKPSDRLTWRGRNCLTCIRIAQRILTICGRERVESEEPRVRRRRAKRGNCRRRMSRKNQVIVNFFSFIVLDTNRRSG